MGPTSPSAASEASTEADSAPAPPARRRARLRGELGAAYARTVSSMWDSGHVATADVGDRSSRLLSIRGRQRGERFVVPRPMRPHDRRGPPQPHRSETGLAGRRGVGRRAARPDRGADSSRHRGIHRLLAFGEIARADGREQHVVLERTEQILGRQHFDPWGRELERERQRIELSADGGHGGAVRSREAKVRLHVPNPLHEQAHRWKACQIGRRGGIDVRVQRRAGPRRTRALLAHGEGHG